ncbi:MAG: MBL fold metallo-hydrolase [Clostridia bacterium]|nr:MBL fold metallo-hydrolase [Clostridia bacterium]
MFDLIKINENDYYIDCPSKVGVVRINENDVVLIDSGNDSSAAKRILRVLDQNNWHLTAIFNTHSHADHIGGNRFFQEKTGCKCYAFGAEEYFANNPSIEPLAIYGGKPVKELNNKFLLAQRSVVLPLGEEVLPNGMTLIPLFGHTENMVGFLTKDKTAFIADAVSREDILKKYGICYYWDYQKFLDALDFLADFKADVFVPSHADATTDISELLAINRKNVSKTKDLILDFLKEPVAFEELLKRIFDRFSLVMTAQQYALVGSTVRSFLSVMREQGLVDFKFEENYMLWQKV